MPETLIASARVTGYIDGVLSGKIPACRWVRLACTRHLNDLEDGEVRGLRFDDGQAKLAIAFFSLLKHSKGEWAGRTFTLEPWEQFILWVLFGWQILDEESGEWLRRFHVGYVEVARKNGKTTLAAGVGLKLFVADGEPGAEVYTVGTRREQAKITHSESTRMVKASPALRKEIGIFKDNLHILETASKFEPLSADFNTLDGLNTHGAICDEVHAWPDRSLWDVIESSTSARRNWLMLAITTAGFDRSSLCWELHEHAERVLEGIIQDDRYFAIIYTLDTEVLDGEGRLLAAGDDWEDEAVWIKANPNLGISKKIAYMRDQAEKAKQIPSRLNSFLRRDLNLWTQSETRWVPLEHWTACGKPVDPEGLRGRTCYGGIDLSSNIDISAWVLVFPPETDDDDFAVLCRFFVPDENVAERSKRDRVPYEGWIRQGFLTATPGNVIDHDFIVAQIEQDAAVFDIERVMFDRWGAAHVQVQLQELSSDPDWLVQFGQGYVSMSPPMKELERLIMGRKLAHGGHPVLTWMAHNLVSRTDPAGNIKPDKEKSREKIDGMVALIMALDGALRSAPTGSVYDERGIRTL